MTIAPSYRADIPRNVRDEVRVIIEPANTRFMLDLRVWEDARFGQVCARVPTKHGLSMDPRKLPELIEALEGARSEAIRLGLLEEGSEKDARPDFSCGGDTAERPSAMKASNAGTTKVCGTLTHHKTPHRGRENVGR